MAAESDKPAADNRLQMEKHQSDSDVTTTTEETPVDLEATATDSTAAPVETAFQSASGKELDNRRIAILVANGFEQVEMTGPREALKDAGARTDLVSPEQGSVKGFNHDKQADSFPVDVQLSAANPNDYDALILPGGVANPDSLRMNPEAVKFVKSFMESGKPVSAICHGPWTLIEVDAVRGRTVTSWPSLKTDLRNAGANWVDQEVVTDHNITTSRKPDDIPAFNRETIKQIADRQPVHGAGQPVR